MLSPRKRRLIHGDFIRRSASVGRTRFILPKQIFSCLRERIVGSAGGYFRHLNRVERRERYQIDMLPTNPADKVVLPKKKRFSGSFYDEHQIIRLLEVAKDEVTTRLFIEKRFFPLSPSNLAAPCFSCHPIRLTSIPSKKSGPGSNENFVNCCLTPSHLMRLCRTSFRLVEYKKALTEFVLETVDVVVNMVGIGESNELQALLKQNRVVLEPLGNR